MRQHIASNQTGRTPRGLIVFDLDGTLVDTLDDLTACANRLLARLDRRPLAPEQVRPMVGDGVPALVRRVLAQAGLPPDAPGPIDEFARDYAANAARASRCFPGVPETLARLHGDGWRLAVCTNKPEDAARLLLDTLGLARFLSAIGGGDSFPTRKPDPGHLIGTIRAAGGETARALLVGDHANDVAAALGARVPCIFAEWGYGPPGMSSGCAATAATIAHVPALASGLLAETIHPWSDSPPP